MKAKDILEKAAGHMSDRATTYDNPEGERSMSKLVEMFNTLYNKDLTEEQGWGFMVLLKIVRTSQGDYRADNYEDMTAYASLMGESAESRIENMYENFVLKEEVARQLNAVHRNIYGVLRKSSTETTPKMEDYFCDPECEHLNPRETDQDKTKQRHICTKYHNQVFHRNAHPFLWRCNECREA